MFSSPTLKARLATKYIPEPMSGCWLWTAGGDPRGYGRVWNGRLTDMAHRAMYEVERGPIPKGMQVCHRCDNCFCVNPDHLFLGTAAENAADMISKGRALNGSRNPNAVLTEPDVVFIRNSLRAGATGLSLAKKYGVSKDAISRIKLGKRWTSVPAQQVAS